MVRKPFKFVDFDQYYFAGDSKKGNAALFVKRTRGRSDSIKLKDGNYYHLSSKGYDRQQSTTERRVLRFNLGKVRRIK